MFLDQLKKVDDEIKEIIINDQFFHQIKPEILRQAVLAYPSRAGKALRPALNLWMCGLFCDRYSQSLKIAAAIELYHIWTLVHDDIIDEDKTRRGAPSLHIQIKNWLMNEHHLEEKNAIKIGIDLAILSGDILQACSNHFFIRSQEDGISINTILSILTQLNHFVNPQLISGEAMDVIMAITPIENISSLDIEYMLAGKTGKLIRFAAETGALVGLNVTDFNHQLIKKAGIFAEKAGLAFQLKDDYLGIFGDPVKVGKPIGSDICQGKRTLLIALAAERLKGSKKKFFLQQLGKIDLKDHDLAKIKELLIESGAVSTVELMIDQLVEECMELLAYWPSNRFRTYLQQWTEFIMMRDY